MNIQTTEIEAAFDELIIELEKVKDLNDIATSYKDHLDNLSDTLKNYYKEAKLKDASIKSLLETEKNRLANLINKMDVPISQLDKLIKQAEWANKENVNVINQEFGIQIAGLNESLKHTEKFVLSSFDNTLKSQSKELSTFMLKLEENFKENQSRANTDFKKTLLNEFQEGLKDMSHDIDINVTKFKQSLVQTQDSILTRLKEVIGKQTTELNSFIKILEESIVTSQSKGIAELKSSLLNDILKENSANANKIEKLLLDKHTTLITLLSEKSALFENRIIQQDKTINLLKWTNISILFLVIVSLILRLIAL